MLKHMYNILATFVSIEREYSINLKNLYEDNKNNFLDKGTVGKAMNATKNPQIVAKRKGAVVNDVIPSIDKLNRLQKLQLLSPATRSARSKTISFFLNPIQQNMPLVYLSLSRSCLNSPLPKVSQS